MQVDTAPDASAAFVSLRGRQYDVAVVDMVLLPGPSGIEVIRYLRSNSPATRVFACTAYYEGDLEAETRALGVEQALHKPVDPKLLVQLIQRLAGPARGGHKTPTPNSGARVPVLPGIPGGKPGLP